ncbi:MAG TPA: endonuclease/exonuclease/phosphatase family protein [Actinomycetota bacterium]|nr:endonuclease/exonuclease/phosphatase family protein [Actinomycetota bacterium]
MLRRLIAIVPVLVLALATVPSTPAVAAPVTVKVMTLNIFYGGDEWNLDTGQWCVDKAGCPETIAHVVSTIEAADADVVGLQEGTANECVLADLLGWFCEPRLQLISRFPLLDPPGANGAYALVEVATGRFVAIGNVHLPSDPYGPYWVRDGEPRSAVLELERTTRLPAIQRELAVLPGLAADGIPVFLTGDFNSPSHLDWTPAVDAVRDEVRYPVVWPVSRALADAGFRDSYREIHPDPVAVPGFTWTPPGTLESVPDEVHDRIDWVLASGPAETIATALVGETGGPDVDVERDPYPTDHRGVVSTFRVEPADPGPFAAVAARRVFIGDPLDVRVHGPGDRVVLVRRGDAPADALVSRSTGGAGDVVLTFPTGALAAGAHDALLVDAGGEVRSRSRFWVYRAGASPSIRTTEAVYEVGEPIRVRWRAAPGYRFDWMGVFSPGRGPAQNAEDCDAGSCGNGHYLLYHYTGSAIQGSAQIGPTSFPGYRTWPLKVGTYEIRLLMDDGYRLLAISNSFKVVHAD